MMGKARWEPDDRGFGVGDAQVFLPSLEDLNEAMQRPGWVAEEPHAHLLPHMSRWCERKGSALTIEDTSIDHNGVFEVSLSSRAALAPGELREAVFGLLSSFAEGATFVHERPVQGLAVFEVTTGMLPEQTSFQSHGHTIRFTVRTSPGDQPAADG
jgi:hypothetical protein